MQLFAFGINYQTAPLDVREQVTFPEDAMESALHDLVQHHPVGEAAIVSTCNRTEVYCSTDRPEEATHWLADYHHLQAGELEPYLYKLPREQAVKHAFRVASGLDSMVLGEPQILGQLKDAVKSAEHAGTLGMMLHKLFQRTFLLRRRFVLPLKLAQTRSLWRLQQLGWLSEFSAISVSSAYYLSVQVK